MCHWFLQCQWSKMYTKWTMQGPYCNATITLVNPPTPEHSWGGVWCGGGGASLAIPCALRRLVFAVSLKFLISVDFLSNVPSYTDWHKAWNLCADPWGHQGDIARVGVVRKTVNRILLEQAATAGLEPGAPRKTTARQERTLFRMVREDHFKSARALTEKMRKLYGVCVDCCRTVLPSACSNVCYIAFSNVSQGSYNYSLQNAIEIQGLNEHLYQQLYKTLHTAHICYRWRVQSIKAFENCCWKRIDKGWKFDPWLSVWCLVLSLLGRDTSFIIMSSILRPWSHSGTPRSIISRYYVWHVDDKCRI